MTIRDSIIFKRVMRFKFVMMIFVWGLIPLLIPAKYISYIGLSLDQSQIIILRAWGVIVLVDLLTYIYIYIHPHAKLTKWLLLFSVVDNAGVGAVFLVLTFVYRFPWGIWANIPFQLFFGYWFWKFFSAGKFKI